ncbi:hypothetical protein CLOM621_06029 [Clostridium sp. M62/1]|nr:hypothetical protein CLOM621_06029 [Clostridium sp. M62/1]
MSAPLPKLRRPRSERAGTGGQGGKVWGSGIISSYYFHKIQIKL